MEAILHYNSPINPFILGAFKNDLPSRKDIEDGTLVLVGARDEAGGLRISY